MLASYRHRFPQPEPLNAFEDGPKEPLWYGHLRHLEDDVPGMSNNFGSEQLRRDLREPWVERYWEKNPTGSGTEPMDWDSRPEESF